MGARNKPFYRLVAADSRFATTGRFLEALGWYDPKQKGDNFSVNIERIDYWTGTGAKLSSTAASLVKKARAGQGAPVEKAAPAAVEAPAVEAPVAEPVEMPEEAAVEDAPAEASEKQEA